MVDTPENTIHNQLKGDHHACSAYHQIPNKAHTKYNLLTIQHKAVCSPASSYERTHFAEKFAMRGDEHTDCQTCLIVSTPLLEAKGSKIFPCARTKS